MTHQTMMNCCHSPCIPCHCSVGWLLLLHVGVGISYVPNTSKTKSMLILSRRKVTGSTLELSIEGPQAEQVRSFEFPGVTINDTLTWSDHITQSAPRCPAASISFVVSHGFFLGLFYFLSLNPTFPLFSTTVTCLVRMHQIWGFKVGDPPQLWLPHCPL